MDIHKPKPWHGVREFLKEYAIIVVGVLTALGAEQGVEWLHWRHALADSREELARDARNIIRDTGEREAGSGCLAREFVQLQGALDRAAETGRLPPIAAINSPVRRAWTIRSFEPAVSGQILPHMGVNERGLMTGANLWSLYIQKNRDEEVRAWTELRSIEGPGRRVGDAELAGLRRALDTAIVQAQVMRSGARHFAGRMVATGTNSPEVVARVWKEGLQSRFNYPCQAPGSDTNDTGWDLKFLQTPQTHPPAAEDWAS